MNGQMRKFNYEKYKKSLESVPDDETLYGVPKFALDLRGIRDYAQAKGVQIAELTEEEQKMFVIPCKEHV